MQRSLSQSSGGDRAATAKQLTSPWGSSVPGGLASDPDHAALAHMYPTPPTNEKYHQLSPGCGDYTAHDSSFGSATTVAGASTSLQMTSALHKQPTISISVSSVN